MRDGIIGLAAYQNWQSCLGTILPSSSIKKNFNIDQFGSRRHSTNKTDSSRFSESRIQPQKRIIVKNNRSKVRASQPQNVGNKDKAQQIANKQEMNGSQKEEADDDDGEAEHSVQSELLKPSRTNISAIVESLNLQCGIAGLGRACQRLIDHGRLQYLRHNLFEGDDSANVGLCHYVPPQTTPQNALLVATRIKAVS